MPTRPRENRTLFPASPESLFLAAGLDEAGRGCLAGPVVAAAVILPSVHNLPGLADSKKISATKRAVLEPLVKQCALSWSVGVVWQERIDEINILQASLEAMARAAASLKVSPSLLLIDGNQSIPSRTLRRFWPDAPFPRQKPVIDGDATIPAISAASIIAKTFRDRLMIKLARRWPEYGFESHKGYGVKAHLAAIRRFGACPLHRRSFKGVDEPSSQLTLC